MTDEMKPKKRKINVHFRVLQQALFHVDALATNETKRLPFGLGEIPPWNSLRQNYRFLADVTEGENYIGTIVEPVHPNPVYDGINHGALLQYEGKKFGNKSVFHGAEWASDLSLEYQLNKGTCEETRLLALIVNSYSEQKERVEHRISQVRVGVTQSPLLAPFNLIRYIFSSEEGRKRNPIANVGELYTVDFKTEWGESINIDESIVYKLTTLGAVKYDIKTSSGDVIVSVKRNQAKRVLSLGILKDYEFEFSEKYNKFADDPDFTGFLISVVHFIHYKNKIRASRPYRDMKPEQIPEPAKILVTD